MTYSEQCKYFLNCFWNEIDEEICEAVWGHCQNFIKIDEQGEKGHDLDEFFSHKFLETLGETLTVLELRAKLREIDVDQNKRMSVTEYLIFKYEKSVKNLVTRPQLGDQQELIDAQNLLDAAQAAMVELQSKLADLEKAEAENKAALDELKAQEDAYNGKIAELEQKSQEGGVVKRNRAKAELEQMKAEDPLPLRRAKINTEAAVRRLEKARKAAEEATAAAVKRFEEAEERLEELKKAGSAEGAIWWMSRELEERKKYLPQSGKKIKHNF